MGPIRKHLTTIIVAMITAMVTAGAPALAHGVAHALFAHNADKVDGFHAVGSGASLAAAKGKLVAHNSAGKIPKKFIPKVADSDKLDGVDSTALQKNCSDGSFLASGFVETSGITGTFGTTGLQNIYTCLGTVNIRKDGTGLFALRFSNVQVGLLSSSIPRGLVTPSSASDTVANYQTYDDGTNVFFQVGLINPDTGTFVDDDFTFMITDLGCSGIICNIIIFPKNQKTSGHAAEPASSPRRSA